MAIDYGRRRCGIAVTDPLQIVANGLTTVDASTLVAFVSDYAKREPLERIIVGYPRQADGSDSESMRYIRPAVGRLKAALPDIPIEFSDERFTSVLAHRAMIDGGMRKSQRRQKGVVDAISAAIILNDWLSAR